MKIKPSALGTVIFSACLVVATQMAQAAEDRRTSFKKLRFEEDYSYLRNPANRTDALDRFKFIPLNQSGSSYLSLGGEMRQRYAYTSNPSFGAAPQDKAGVWLQRFVVQGDVRVGPNFRLFGQLYSALEAGRKGGASPVDENKLELQNAFFEVRFPPSQAISLRFRGGRQELQLGSGRLVDVREGPNVRRTFDAGRFIFEVPDWRIDALAARPRQSLPGVFDDNANKDQTLWGIYATGGKNVLPAGQLDLYYLGFKNDTGAFEQATAKEVRHSLGVRWWGKLERWDFNWEAIYQFGKFGSGNISAWTLASNTGYTWSDLSWRPRLALSTNIASGDKDAGDNRLGTFNALFPRGNYFSQAAVLGPRNFYNINPSISVTPAPDWSLSAELNFFWRLQKQDGVYGPGGQLLRAAGGSNERFVGSALSLTADWELSRNLSFSGVYSHFFPGAFIKQTGPAANIDFFEITLKSRF